MQQIETIKNSRQKINQTHELPDIPRIERFIDAQRIQEGIFPHENEDVNADVELLFGEVAELKEAIEDYQQGKGSLDEIRREIPDVIILTLGLANYFGVNVDAAIGGKFARNYQKYNPRVREQLASQDWEPTKIMSFLKEKWDRAKDELF